MVPAIPQSQPSDVPTPARTSWGQCAGAVEAVRPPLRVKCPGLPPKPPAGQLQQVVSQADKHRENWDKVFVMWDELREFLYSLSSVLQETATSSHPLKLERALLQKLADTTASRYLSILLSFCQRAQESEVDLSSCRAVSLLDLVYSMHSDPKLTIHSCNTLKALRWVSKTFLVELHAWSPLMQVLEAGRDGQRREALPLPPSFMLYLERRVLGVSLDASSRIFSGSILVATMSSLRFSDAQHVRWSTMSLAGQVWRGVVYRSKTSRQGMPVGLMGSGLLILADEPSKSWIRVWLHLLGDVWDAFPAFEPDVLFFSHDASSFSPLSYCQTLRLCRTLLVDYAPQCDPFAYSLHSVKTSVLAALAQLDLDEPARKLQGHHRVSSMTRYGRDDVSGAVRAQVKFLNALRSGFVPVTPIGRGGQVPIPSDSLDLTPVVGACVPEHPRFSYAPEHQVSSEGAAVLPVPVKVLPTAAGVSQGVLTASESVLSQPSGSAPVAAASVGASSFLEESDVEPDEDPQDWGQLDEITWVRMASGIFHLVIQKASGSEGRRTNFALPADVLSHQVAWWITQLRTLGCACAGAAVLGAVRGDFKVGSIPRGASQFLGQFTEGSPHPCGIVLSSRVI